MTKKTISKRQWRDGVSAKPKNSRRPSENTAAKAKRPSEKPASGRAAVQRPSENKTSNRFENRTEAPKQHAAKAKKLVVRNPNRKIMERARDLKERQICRAWNPNACKKCWPPQASVRAAKWKIGLTTAG